MNDIRQSNFIWIDGEFVPTDQADLDLLSRPQPEGSVFYEDIYCYETEAGPAVFRLEEHLNQFLETIRNNGHPVCYSLAELRNTVHGTLCFNGVREGTIRSTLVMPPGTGRAAQDAPTWAIAAWDVPLRADAPHPEQSFERSIVIEQDLPEGAALFVVKEGQILTPPSARFGNQVLRNSVVTLARDLGYPVHEKRLTHAQVYAGDEAFISTSVDEITAVVEMAGNVIGNGRVGEVTRSLQKALYETTRGRGRRSQEWLDWVWGSFVGL